MSSGALKPGCGCIPPRTPRSQSRSAGRISRPASRGPPSPEPKIVSTPPGPTLLSTLLACDKRQSKWVYEHCQGPILHKVLRVFEWSGDVFLSSCCKVVLSVPFSTDIVRNAVYNSDRMSFQMTKKICFSL